MNIPESTNAAEAGGFIEQNIAPKEASVDFAYQRSVAERAMEKQTEDFSLPQNGPLAGLSKRAVYAIQGRPLEPVLPIQEADVERSGKESGASTLAPAVLTIGEPIDITHAFVRPENEKMDSDMRKERHEVVPERNTNVDRVKRDQELAQAVERCTRGERLSEIEERRLMAALQNRGWFKLLDEERVKPGNAMISFLVPSGEIYGIKHFNDELFGPQKTDEMIARRRRLFGREMHGTDLEHVASSIKDEMYTAETPPSGSEEYMKHAQEMLRDTAERMHEEMTVMLAEMALEERSKASGAKAEALHAFLRTMLGESSARVVLEQGELLSSFRRVMERYEEALIQADAKYVQKKISSSERDHAASLVQAARVNVERVRQELRGTVQSALEADPTLGYRITFGISLVGQAESKSDRTHVERAVSESMKGAFRARSSAEYGKMFSVEEAQEAIDESGRLRKEIGEQFLTDAEGRSQRVLEWKSDGLAVMNADMIRDIRKGVFQPAAGEEKLFEQVKAYITSLNFFDVIKPYTHEELAGGIAHGSDGTIADQIADTKNMIRSIEARTTDATMRAAIGSELRKEAKDRTCTSAMEFNSRALEIPSCTYICLDVLDVGPELLREYERLMQLVEHHRMDFDEAQLIAGDETTKKLRKFRAEVTNVYHEQTGDGAPLMLVGGDEAVMAVPTAIATDDLLMALRKIRLNEETKASVRVIRCAVGTGDRVSDPHDRDTTIHEHLLAKKIAEDGSTLAKAIERDARMIERLVYDLPRDEREAHLSALRRLNIQDFAIRQVSGGERIFDLILEDPDQPNKTIRETSQKVVAGMTDLRNRLSEEVEKRREELFMTLSTSYNRLKLSDMPAVLRRYHRADANASDGDFKAYMKQYI